MNHLPLKKDRRTSKAFYLAFIFAILGLFILIYGAHYNKEAGAKTSKEFSTLCTALGGKTKQLSMKAKLYGEHPYVCTGENGKTLAEVSYISNTLTFYEGVLPEQADKVKPVAGAPTGKVKLEDLVTR